MDSSATPPKHTLNELKAMLSGAGFIFACRIAGAGLVFITQVLLARWMGAEQLGIYVFAYSWCIVLAASATLGLPGAAFRVISESLIKKDYGLIRGFVHQSRFFSLAASLVLVAVTAAIVTSTSLVPEEQQTTVLVAMLWIPLFSLMQLQENIAHAHSWFGLAFLPTTVSRPLLFLLIVAATFFADQALSAERVMAFQLGAMLLIAIIQTALISRQLRKTTHQVAQRTDTAKWLHTALPLLLVGMYLGYFPEVSVIIASFFLPPAEIAIYNVDLRLTMLISFGIFAIDGINRPIIAQLYARGNMAGVQKRITQATHLMLWPSLLATVIFYFFGQEILLIFGDEFVAGHETLMLLCVCQVLIAFSGPSTSTLSATGHQQLCLRAFVVSFAALIPLTAVLTPLYGAKGASVALIITTLIWTLLLKYQLKKILNQEILSVKAAQP